MSSTTTTAPSTDTDLGQQLFNRTVCLSLAITKLGVSKKAGMGQVTVAADKTLLNLSKKILVSRDYTAIIAAVQGARQTVKQLALPSPFRSGVYLVPVEMVETLNEKLAVHKAEFHAAAAAFCSTYPALVEQMAAPLDALYNPQDYPSLEKVRAAFTFEWQYISWDVPGRLRTISKSLFAQEGAKAAAKWAEGAQVVRDAYRASMAELVAMMAEKLSPNADGKKRQLRESTVDKLREFLTTFEVMNVTNDDELTILVDRARDIMNGFDIEQVREDVDLRARVQASFQTIADEVKTLVVDRETRIYDFGDE